VPRETAPAAPSSFRIAGNGADVHQHFLWSLSFQRFRSHRFHNASRKLFDQDLQSSSLAFAFAFTPRRIRFAGTVFVGIGHGAILTYLASELSISTTSETRRCHPISRRDLPPSRCGRVSGPVAESPGISRRAPLNPVAK